MHLALVYDGNDLLLYKDGTLVDIETGIGPISIKGNTDITIGRGVQGVYSSNVFLDDVRIYGTALTPAQINFVMNGCDLETPNESVCKNEGIPITATVPQDLTFNISSNLCNLGSLSASSTNTCTHTMSASTNATHGYTINYLPTNTLTSANLDEITATGEEGEAANAGTKQFGFNLAENTDPSVGASASGGVGVVSENYDTPNIFSFNANGAEVASSSEPSETTTYTASYMANIDGSTEAGEYSATITYVITASY